MVVFMTVASGDTVHKGTMRNMLKSYSIQPVNIRRQQNVFYAGNSVRMRGKRNNGHVFVKKQSGSWMKAVVHVARLHTFATQYYFSIALIYFHQALCNKKLSCRREAAPCFVSLNILLIHLMSLKNIRNDTLEKGICKSLLVFHCNYVSISYRFWDIQRQTIAWLWNLG